MDYCKYQADYLFNGSEILNDRQVLITDKTGLVVEITDEMEAGDDIQRLDGLLSPGFVNCHCHLELSHMKGMIEKGLGMTGFLRWVVQHRDFSQDMIQQGIVNGNQEMYDNGIVAVGDISNTTDTLAVKSEHKLVYRNFVEALGFNDSRAAGIMTHFSAVRELFELNTGFPATVVPHAPYTISPSLFELIGDAAVGKVLSMHNQESLQEQQFMLTGNGDFRSIFQDLNMDLDNYHGRGMNSLQFAWKYLERASKLVFVHNVTTTQADLDALSDSVRKKIYWCFCINANLFINNLVPPIDLFRRNGAKLVIGTDSLASNDRLSVLDELKSVSRHFPHIPQQELLQWATSNGAEALEFQEMLGRFVPGKRPGVILVEKLKDGMIHERSTVRRLI